MCGFTIIYSKNGITKIDKLRLSYVMKGMYNRGPDEQKKIFLDNIAIGFNRLSINDIETASQPLFSKCKKYIIIAKKCLGTTEIHPNRCQNQENCS